MVTNPQKQDKDDLIITTANHVTHFSERESKLVITSIEEFKTAKTAKAKPLVSRQRAVLCAGALVVTVANCERNDLLAAMRFDLTPDDLTAIEAFIFHLNHRIQERVNGYVGREGTSDQQPA